MSAPDDASAAARTVALYPWFRFFQNLLFWQAIWFLFFQSRLSAAEAILLYAIYDMGTLLLEVPSGYLSDRIGRRITLIVSALAGFAATALLSVGDSFAVFALAQVLLGASMAFASGTDSALLYESLVRCGRQDDVEREELRAWRFSFTALAVSALAGGGLGLVSDRLPFAGAAAAFACALVVALRFHEPGGKRRAAGLLPDSTRLATLRTAFRTPALLWLFALSVAMYGFSHVPFVFGQPFILEALDGIGFAHDAPVVSGAVTAAMMVLSVGTSHLAPWLRARLGLAALLLLAYAMQVGLIWALTQSVQALAIALLFLRMVPDSLSGPFIRARVQTLLSDDSRATYVSIQSLVGRLAFAGTLYLAAIAAPDAGQLAFADLHRIMGAYAMGGALYLALLGFAATRIRI
jgi:MFS family permease